MSMRFILRFSTSSDFISWTIRRRTDFSISHVEFQLLTWPTPDEVKEYGRVKGSSIPAPVCPGWTLGSRFPKGVAWRPPQENVGQRNVVTAKFDGIDAAALWVAKNRIGFPYDTRGIFGIAAGVEDWHNKSERFCSETVLEGAEEGPKNFLLNPWAKQWFVTPRDLFISPRVEILSGP